MQRIICPEQQWNIDPAGKETGDDREDGRTNGKLCFGTENLIRKFCEDEKTKKKKFKNNNCCELTSI
jgi:hypothetical protein